MSAPARPNLADLRPLNPPAPGGPVARRAIALPSEHGGWGMLGEPILLGLVLAFSRPGLGLAVAALGAFLARHPLRLALSDWRRGVRYPRTPVAWQFALGYSGLALLGLAATWGMPARAWVPLALAAPLGLVQLFFDARLQGRQLLPELCGGTALGGLAAAILLAGGWSSAPAAAAWALLAAKAVGSVLYVRTRLRLDRGQKPAFGPALGAHAAGLALALGLAWAGIGPWLGAAAATVLLLRTAWGLSPWHRVVRPQAVGYQEVGFGSLTVVLLAVGWSTGL